MSQFVKFVLFVLFVPFASLADTPPPGTVKIKGGSDSTTIGNVTDSLKTNVTNFPATQTVVQPAFVNASITNTSVGGTAVTFTAPANAIGFILESDSTNSDNIRWAIGSTATASVGNLYEPGRDTGYIPLAKDISVIALSGTQSVSVQWVIR